MDKIEKELVELKDEIDKAKREYAKGEGQKEQILKSLEKEVGTTNISKAEKIMKSLEKENEELEELIEKKFKELKENYEW